MEYPENLQYLYDKQITLLKYVRSKKVVFLDMNHWNWIRKMHILGPQNQDDAILFNRIMDARGKVIFPIEAGILMETLKQADPISFAKTIEVMDMLSDGIAIVPYDERQFIECYMFFDNPDKFNDNEFINKYPVFTRSTMINGSKIPIIKEYGRDWNIIAQKSFIDYLWGMQLGEMYKIAEFNIDGSAAKTVPRFDDLADSVNKFNEKYNDVFSSWEELIDIELQGTIDVGKKYLEYGIAYLVYKKTGMWPSYQEFNTVDKTMGPQNLIYGLFKRGELSTQFPFIQVSANMFASIRWNKSGKMTGNDQYDIVHSTCALPYCDAFFTDKKTVFHLTNGNVNLHKRYNCYISHKLSDIANILK